MVKPRPSLIDLLTLFLAWTSLSRLLTTPAGSGIAVATAFVLLSPYVPLSWRHLALRVPLAFAGGWLVTWAWKNGASAESASLPDWLDRYVIPAAAYGVVGFFAYRWWRSGRVRLQH